MKYLPGLLFPLLAFLSSGQGKITVMNKGISGNTTYDLVRRMEKDVISQHPDIVIIMIGTNDMLNSKKFVSYKNFTSNYQKIIDTLRSKKISLILMSPPPTDTGYLFQRHNRNDFKILPNEKLDSISCIIQKLAIDNELSFIDINKIFKEKGSPARETDSLIINYKNSGIKDGVHPTSIGYQLIANEVFDLLRREHLLKSNTKIICFGDSITFGAFMNGQGTSGGETYPAYLKRLIMEKFGCKDTSSGEYLTDLGDVTLYKEHQVSLSAYSEVSKISDVRHYSKTMLEIQ